LALFGVTSGLALALIGLALVIPNIGYSAAAAVMLNEFKMKEQPEILGDAIIDLMHNRKRHDALAANLHTFARPHALDDMVELILSVLY